MNPDASGLGLALRGYDGVAQGLCHDCGHLGPMGIDGHTLPSWASNGTRVWLMVALCLFAPVSFGAAFVVSAMAGVAWRAVQSSAAVPVLACPVCKPRPERPAAAPRTIKEKLEAEGRPVRSRGIVVDFLLAFFGLLGILVVVVGLVALAFTLFR